jgi:hypothetical protein
MGCLGVHYAIALNQGGRLWDGDEAARSFARELEDEWDDYYRQPTGKAWDAIHRCLADGTLRWAGGDWPLNGAILGGDPMYLGSGYIIMFLHEDDVAEVAEALDQVIQPWFRERFFALPAHGYEGRADEAGFDYTWYWFERMRAFFRKTADEGRQLVFTADQLAGLFYLAWGGSAPGHSRACATIVVPDSPATPGTGRRPDGRCPRSPAASARP